MNTPLNHPASPSLRRSRLAAWVWAALYLVVLAILVAGVFYGLGLRCEGFGCMGLGVYWFAWACVYGAGLVLGFWARSRAKRTGVALRLVPPAIWAQVLVGALLLAWWQWPR